MDVGKYFFMEGIVKPCSSLTFEVVESLFLEVFSRLLDVVLKNMV